MIFTVVLITLLIQWFVNLEGRYRYNGWFSAYYFWINKTVKVPFPWLNVAIWILPFIILAVLLHGMFHHFWGIAGQFIFNLLLLWYCTDYDGAKDRAKKDNDMGSFFTFTFERVFAMIFWYAFLGVMGLTLYYMVCVVRNTLEQLNEHNQGSWQVVNQLRGILDWVPLRIVGLTFALVGRFSTTFAAVFKATFTGVGETRKQVVEWAELALEEGHSLAAALALVDRTLLVWLVALALLSVGAWVG